MKQTLTDEELAALPVITLSGINASSWQEAYDFGRHLEVKFGDQECQDFAQALQLAESKDGPEPSKPIDGLICAIKGYNDGPAWVWIVTYEPTEWRREVWALVGSCDYTGWDCQAGAEWTKLD